MPDTCPPAHAHAPAPDLSPAPDPVPVAVALEGGGALGAFGWGVLERLLDEPGLRIAAASGASAGAMNAAMLAQGLATGGPGRAKYLLEIFWRRAAVASGSPDLDLACWAPGPAAALTGPFAAALRRAALLVHHPNPLLPNPLRSVLDGLLDPSAFGRDGAPMLAVSATNVRTGEAKLFAGREVTADALLASACLPHVFPAVRIGGEAYWDGGYASNPPLRPLIEAGAPADVIVVRTTPSERPDVPLFAGEIVDRLSELAFGAALRQELRALATARRLLAEVPDLPEGGALARLRDARVHMIGDDRALRSLRTGSELDPSWGSLLRVRELGIDAAERWLAAARGALGQRSSFDLAALAEHGLGSRPDGAAGGSDARARGTGVVGWRGA